MKALFSILGLGLAVGLSAQSPLTTSFAAGNGGGAGWQVFFNLQVNSQITLRGLEVHLNNVAGTPGTIEMWTTPTTYVGAQQTAGLWTSVASGSVLASGFVGVPTPVCFTTPLTMAPGSYGVAIRYIGVAPLYTNGNGTAVPGSGTNQTFLRTEVELRGGEGQATPFVSTPFAPRIWNGSLLYYPGVDAGLGCSAAPAKNEGFNSEGCYRHRGSIWDAYNPAAAAATACQAVSLALSNKAIKYIPSAGSYFVTPSTNTFVTPVSPINLAGFVPNADDGEVTQVLASPGFPGPSGTLTSLVVHSNGIIADGPIDAWLGGATASYIPTLAKLHDAPVTAWYHHHDFNVGEAGSGQIQFHEDATTSYFTWNDVENYPTGGTANRTTMQFQFNRTTGEVDLVWGSIAVAGVGNSVSDLHLVGYSPGGTSLVHPETDLSTFTGVLLETLDVFPLTLAVNGRVVLGSNLTYTVSNETAVLPFGIGIIFFSLFDLTALGFPPPLGLDLGLIGATGCPLNVEVSVAPLTPVVISPGGMSTLVVVPLLPSLVGTPWHVQAVYFDPTANPFGALTSNYIKQDVGTW